LAVVEDDPDIADFLRAYFRASGYDVVHLDPSSVDEGMEAVREHRPDCVLLDLWLRGFNGLQLYRRIRTHDEFDLVPVIVLTADVAARPRAEPMATGIDGFVPKPFQADELADIVAGRLAEARRLGEGGVLDPATGAFTPAVLDARIAAELEIAATAGEPLAFALVTLRSLRELRATLGEAGLGWLVRQLVDELRPLLPAGGAIGRTDPEELVLLLPGLPARTAADAVEQALGKVRRTRALPGGGEVHADPVAGIAAWPEHAVDAEGLFMAADAALADALAGSAGPVVVAR
jgi:DNA-binding response OmpR family regulator